MSEYPDEVEELAEVTGVDVEVVAREIDAVEAVAGVDDD